MTNFYLGLDLGQVSDPTAIAIVEKTVWVKGKPETAKVKISSSPLGIAPGRWVKLQYSGVKKDDSVSKPSEIKIRVGRHPIAESAIVFTAKDTFGFFAPDLDEGESAVLPVLVLKKGATT